MYEWICPLAPTAEPTDAFGCYGHYWKALRSAKSYLVPLMTQLPDFPLRSACLDVFDCPLWDLYDVCLRYGPPRAPEVTLPIVQDFHEVVGTVRGHLKAFAAFTTSPRILNLSEPVPPAPADIPHPCFVCGNEIRLSEIKTHLAGCGAVDELRQSLARLHDCALPCLNRLRSRLSSPWICPYSPTMPV
jgi:hypothetical protein